MDTENHPAFRGEGLTKVYGSDKSTPLNILGGLDSPTEGRFFSTAKSSPPSTTVT